MRVCDRIGTPPRNRVLIARDLGEEMQDNKPTTELTHRRSFFGRIAGLSALGLFGVASAAERAQAAPADGPDWPGQLKGRHKQLFDVYTINAGFPLGFVNNFLTP